MTWKFYRRAKTDFWRPEYVGKLFAVSDTNLLACMTQIDGHKNDKMLRKATDNAIEISVEDITVEELFESCEAFLSAVAEASRCRSN